MKAPNPSFTPKWSEKPLLKSWEKQMPKLGWPRETDSLCPKCVPEIRNKIINGELPVEILKNEKPGADPRTEKFQGGAFVIAEDGGDPTRPPVKPRRSAKRIARRKRK